MDLESVKLNDSKEEHNILLTGETPISQTSIKQETLPDLRAWALHGLDIALTRIEQVQRTLVRASELFREENKTEANRYFVHCIDGLERFLEATSSTRSALKLDFSKVAIEGTSLSQIETELLTILQSIVKYQESSDYSGLADKIEYELITNLYSWAVILGQLRISLHSNA